MKRSQELTTPAFFKKQSHIHTGSGDNADTLPLSNIRKEAYQQTYSD